MEYQFTSRLNPTINALRISMMIAMFALTGCAGSMSQSFRQTLAVVVPHDVDFKEIEYYAKRSKSAYDEPADIRKTYSDVTRVTTIQPQNVRYFLETNEAAGTQTLSVRGTAVKPNIWQDVEATLIADSALGVSVHKGFQNDAQAVFEDVRPYLRKDMDIRVTGHSLGAAIALILGGYISNEDGYNVTRVVNFGQPKVTDDEPKRVLGSKVTRVIDDRDVVPMLPPPGFIHEYHHIGPELILRPGKDYVFLDDHDSGRVSVDGFWQEFSDFSVEEHFMVNYLANIQGKLENGAKQVPYIVRGQ